MCKSNWLIVRLKLIDVLGKFIVNETSFFKNTFTVGVMV